MYQNKKLIVCASDFVGFHVVEFLVETKYDIDYLVLDEKDRGGYNEQIISAFCSIHDKNKIIFNDNLKESNFIQKLKNLEIDIGILAWWPYLLKGQILSIPNKGWLNFHPSYLPFNRGKHPNFWCLVDETPCGVSLQFIDEGIDTGDIVARENINTTWEDTGKSVYEKSRLAIIQLFKREFENIKKNPSRIKQELEEGTYHKSTEIEEITNIKLDERYTARKLLNILRGKMFPPHPTAYFIDNGIKYSVKIKIERIKDD